MPPDEAKGTQNDIGSVSEDDDGEQLVPCEFCHQSPHHPRNPALSPKIHPIFSPPSIPVTDSDRSRCRMDRERFEPGGRECPDLARKRQRGGRGEAEANAVPLAGGLFEERRAKPATGPGSVLPAPSRAGAGHRCGPVADMAHSLARQGPCRNTRPKQLPRPVQAAAGATRAEGPEEGQVDKPTSTCVRGRAPVGWGRHPANSGPRAVSATQCMSQWLHLNL
jgi:hypothetical protein